MAKGKGIIVPEFTVGSQLLGKLGRRDYGRLLDNLIKVTRKERK